MLLLRSHRTLFIRYAQGGLEEALSGIDHRLTVRAPDDTLRLAGCDSNFSALGYRHYTWRRRAVIVLWVSRMIPLARLHRQSTRHSGNRPLP